MFTVVTNISRKFIFSLFALLIFSLTCVIFFIFLRISTLISLILSSIDVILDLIIKMLLLLLLLWGWNLEINLSVGRCSSTLPTLLQLLALEAGSRVCILFVDLFSSISSMNLSKFLLLKSYYCTKTELCVFSCFSLIEDKVLVLFIFFPLPPSLFGLLIFGLVSYNLIVFLVVEIEWDFGLKLGVRLSGYFTKN